MARTERDVEAYLDALGEPWEKLDHATYLLRKGVGNVPTALRLAGALVVLRVAVGQIPSDNPAGELSLLRRALELNAADLVYASYGLEGSELVLTATLELESLDLNELETALADIDLALTRHLPELHTLRTQS